MPWTENKDPTGVLALPDGFDLNPGQDEEVNGSVLGAAWRRESPIGSALNDYDVDRNKPFDPDYRPWNDIQGTEYEGHAERFVEARDAKDVLMLKAQIDREMEDRKVLDAAGPWGFMAQMGAAMLSPTILLPGGAIVKGARGVSIAATAGTVGVAAGIAAAIDEVALTATQETRTGAESAVAIGGSVILGGLLGGAVGAFSRTAFNRSAAIAEQLPGALRELDGHLQSINAARVVKDLTIRRERLFQFINKTPVLRAAVRTDPILRGMLSDNMAARQVTADLVDTPLQYATNAEGIAASKFGTSAEAAINARRNTDLSQAYGTIHRNYAEYANDGTAGVSARITAPVKSMWRYLLNDESKWSFSRFDQEVGKALMSGDVHPVPQVQKAAQQIRATIFDRIKQDAIDVGIFDPDLKLNNATSYFTRVYNTKKIAANRRSGTGDDMAVVLEAEFKRKRAEAEQRLVNDRTVDQLEADRFLANERARTAQTALNRARKKADDKKARAEGAVRAAGSVGRATRGLRKLFQRRADDLSKGVLDGEELAAFKDTIRQARSVKKMEPQDILSAIREAGGIRDDGSGELQAVLDRAISTVKRNDGMHPDEMRGHMAELGYLDETSTVDDLMVAIRENAHGRKVYSRFDADQVAEFEAMNDLIAGLERGGVDISQPIEKIIPQIEGMARSQKIQKAKKGEAQRSANKTNDREVGAHGALMKAMDRLDAAEERIRFLNEDAGPKVREEIKTARAELKKIIPKLKKAKAARAEDEFFAGQTDRAITAAVDDAINSILGLKPGQHSYAATLSSPTRARTLDVADELLWPWLETDASKVIGHYSNSLMPDIEIVRRFGDVNLTEAKLKITDDMNAQLRDKRLSQKRRTAIQTEARERIKDLQGMADRMRGIYGVPDNPDSAWVRGSRGLRTLTYMGYLGGMTLSAIPDAAGIIGRNGLEAAFGSMQAVTNPRRWFEAVEDAAEFGASAEWWLNSRSASMFEVMDPYGHNSRFERFLGASSSAFGVATGMVPWNVAMKSIGGAYVASKMSKAAVKVAKGTESKADLRKLAENGIDWEMALKIAKQIEKHADRDGMLWLPKGQQWDDAEAFDAFRAAMNREMNIMVITPGQDKPLSFSSEPGKFFSQFKTFAASAHHRILLSGIQRSDGAVLSQVLLAVALGLVVSKAKTWQGGYEPKKGAALWEDALDRSGITGWLMEVHGISNALTGGALSLSGEVVSRYGSRSALEGLLGPSVDMAVSFGEGIAATARGKVSKRDARSLLRPVPGNNLPYLMGLTNKVAQSMSEMLSD